MLNEINSDNPVEEVEASDIKEDNSSVDSSTPAEEVKETKDYLSTSLFEDVKTITSDELESQNEAVHAAIDALRVQKSVLAAQFFELFGLARLYLELLSQVSRHTTELALTIYHKSIHNSRLPGPTCT